MPAGVINATVQATLTLGATALAGVVLNNNASNKDMIVLYRKATGASEIRLYFRSAGSLPAPTLTVPVTFATPSTLYVSSTATTVTVLWNGASVINYTFTAPQIANIKTAANRSYGLWAQSDNLTNFDDFRIQVP